MSATDAPQPIGRYFALSTEQVAPGDRRAFWADVALNRSAPDFPDASNVKPFSASVRGYLGPGAQIRDGRSDPVTLRRTAAQIRQDGSDEILLSAIVEHDGPSHFQINNTTFALRPGTIEILDLASPFVVRTGRYREINFRLPRASVAQAIGADPGRLSGHVLPDTPLTSLLFSNLLSFANCLPGMSDAERQVALHASTDFALATLGLTCRGADRLEEAHWDGLWAAATQFIDRNHASHDLAPDGIAAALRCSRAYVYRLFRRRGVTIMGYVQAVRLDRARTMLADPRCRLSIAEIAYVCGFADPSAFSRSFRARFGCQPRDVRGGQG